MSFLPMREVARRSPGEPPIAATIAALRSVASAPAYGAALAIWCGVFCCGFFVFPAEWPQRVLFYGGIPLTLPSVVAIAGPMWRSPLGRAILAFLAWSALSALWSDHWLSLGDQSRKAACIAYFVAICCAIGSDGAAIWRRMLRYAQVFAAIAATALAFDYLWNCTDCERFIGYGRFANANYTASVTGAFAVLALTSVLSEPGPLRWPLLACQIPISILLLQTGSRAALLAYLASAVLSAALLALHRRATRARQALLVVAAGVALLAGVVAWKGHAWLESELGRGDTYRLQIWRLNLARVAERPWFGHGSTARDTFVVDGMVQGYHAHNLFLAQAFYGGIPGLALWIAVFVLAARAAIRAWSESGDVLPPVCLFFLLAVGMVDIGPVVVGIEAIWLYVWFTLGIVTSCDIARRARAPATAR